MAAGLTVTVMLAEFEQPLLLVTVYLMTDEPEVRAVTTPVLLTKAISGFELLQRPPGVVSCKVGVVERHMDVVPVIVPGAKGRGLIVITALPVIGTEVTGEIVIADTV